MSSKQILELDQSALGGEELEACLAGNWKKMRDKEHFVQFYEDDAYLVESVGDFIGSGLGAGSGAIVIATEDHRAALERRLESQGINVSMVKARGQFVPLDAAETLSMFMHNGMPDESLFNEVVGDIVVKTSHGRRNLRAFGEMVALLWADGNGAGAIRLEELWNDLAKIHAFSLFCAYPMSGFRNESCGVPFLHICKEHTRVIPAESFGAKQQHTDDDRLRTIAVLQQKAIALESEVAQRKRIEEELRKAKDDLARANKELEARVAERTDKLQQSMEELEAFSYSISHDMRSPLRAMYAHAAAVLEDHRNKLDGTAIDSLERIKRASTRLDLLVRDVLAYSKVTKGDVTLSPVNLETLVEDVIRSQFETVRDQICIDGPLERVFGHEAYVSQCLTNLLGNALKFSAPGTLSQVRVRTERVGNKVRVSVSDNGIGIKPEHFDRIFKMFGRVYAEKDYEGTGIGLCIVKRAVEKMGGETGFVSSPGKGSAFWFELSCVKI